MKKEITIASIIAGLAGLGGGVVGNQAVHKLTDKVSVAPMSDYKGAPLEVFESAIQTDPVFTKVGNIFIDPEGRKCRIVKSKDSDGYTWETINE